ncbi:NAD+ synthase [Caldanaerobacter subterraneus]|uniref:Glutamine-dependent NAD(+) synthetase n=1 Tax=Caldanaerobacter subterraneus TaxID=911092 RepID=A0A7Y2L8B6_9THEO|nr:NAD+ synthase [Caldanaerobacter subterraneus]NNG67677.1 NAD+ synthase [Caldanaerobacter subterraneus]
MKIALAQINPVVGDIKHNCEKIVKYIEKAKEEKADLVVFPELSTVGYPPKDFLFVKDFIKTNEEMINKIILPATDEIAVILGTVRKDENKNLYNSAFFVCNREIIEIFDKTLLPNYDVFDEKRYFSPSSQIKTVEFKGVKVAVNICEDAWKGYVFEPSANYSVDVLEEQFKLKPDIFINISASPYHLGKHRTRLGIMKEKTDKYGIPFVYVNQVGANDELIFDGNSFVLNEKGKEVIRLKGFEEDFKVVELQNLEDFEELPELKEDISWIYKALVIGVRDYFHKLGFKKAVLGLSGGIDSAVVAVIASEAMGKENVLAISMPSRYSSEGSVKDAEILAKNLGIDFRVIPIEPVFKSYLSVFNKDGNALGDVAEENVQARIRGNYLMFFANREGYVVLTTGNKSELAMGYCTLYGDMSGSLAVIGDLYKTQVYELARYINREKEIIPVSIIKKVPSAELRPNQKDEDSLPPYRILDQVLKLYLEENASVEEIAEKGFDKDLVRHIINTVNKNEYKRKQAPPVLRVSPKAFGTGRRMPIVQNFKA